jgi:hypothetical protein
MLNEALDLHSVVTSKEGCCLMKHSLARALDCAFIEVDAASRHDVIAARLREHARSSAHRIFRAIES